MIFQSLSRWNVCTWAINTFFFRKKFQRSVCITVSRRYAYLFHSHRSVFRNDLIKVHSTNIISEENDGKKKQTNKHQTYENERNYFVKNMSFKNVHIILSFELLWFEFIFELISTFNERICLQVLDCLRQHDRTYWKKNIVQFFFHMLLPIDSLTHITYSIVNEKKFVDL